MKTVGIAMLAAVVVVAMAGVVALAEQENAEKRKLEDRKEFPGTVVCIGCELEKRGAEAQCTLHAKHAQGLLAPDGTLWTFIDNTRGHHLVREKKLLGKELKIYGWSYPKTRYIEVWKFQLKKGDRWIAYDYCRICGHEPGDFHDTDLCPECAEDAEGE